MSEDNFHRVVCEAKELIKLVENSSVRRVVLGAGEFRIVIERSAPDGLCAAGPVAAAPTAAAAVASGVHRVLSPMVGTFYRAGSPDAKPFAEVGARVEQGQAIGIIEAMKVMNEVAADVAGVVVELLVANGQPVQFEQPLIAIDTQA
jgi:acetyl-CoA carboxylase biotin carboxyl carrier protein